jgi:FkbM family methyltransferase
LRQGFAAAVGHAVRRSPRQALVPGVIREVREAQRFCAVRGWKTDFRRFQAARLAHLDLVPPGVSLAGGLVVDVGANRGDWTAAVLVAEPTVRVIAIEPNGKPFARLVGRFEGDSRVRIDPRAVSDAPGTVEFYVTGHPHNASLLKPRAETQVMYGSARGWQVKRSVEVEATTLDALTDGDAVALIKIDVQGAESKVLAGARETLKRTSAVLLEVTFVSHYDGDSDFALLHRKMLEHGFTLVDLTKPFATAQHPALWADACYIKNGARPASAPR